MSRYENDVFNYSRPLTNPDPINRPKSGVAEVVYRQSDVDGAILVVDLVGFLTPKGVEERYGEAVSEAYYGIGDNLASVMYLCLTGGLKTVIQKLTGEIIIGVGEWYTSEEFGKRIAYMKKCGARLSGVVKMCRLPAAKSVKI
jgi:hypothetical protein